MAAFNPEKAMFDIKREFGEHGGVCPSVDRSSTFTVMDPKTMPEIFSGLRGPDKGGCFLYSRHFNPTVEVLARYLAAMENTEAAVCTASGMSAISSVILQLCRTGDHIVAGHTIYGGTWALLHDLLPSMGIATSFVNPADPEAFRRAMTDRTRIIYVETLANPTLRLADIPVLAGIARDHNAALVVDNTFTPMIVSPARLGADVVVHSLTKFINGASDLIAGAICGSRELAYKLMDLHTGRVMLLGPTMDPRVAFDVLQRLPHLAIRVRAHSDRAMAMAQHLHALGAPVTYPGLASHPQHDRLNELMNPGYGFGGIFNIDCGHSDRAERLLDFLQNERRFGLIAVSLGYYDTLMSCSGSSTSSEIPPEDQTTMGLSPGLIRISVGLTGQLDDQLAALEAGAREVGLI